MAKIQFTNPETAELYESDYQADPRVHVPGGSAGNGWEGKLSDIPPHAAAKLVAQKSNLLKAKKHDAKNSNKAVPAFPDPPAPPDRKSK